ncbi:hypothetical protein [Haloplanus litoreus]|uniref:Uncharacterized protein n=1 Tax=Haloplanus litoreus TaxID=767515 RepID=A0ABD6A454_9EURY
MGGSFESGAGDDPNDLFANNDADEEEITNETDVLSEPADEEENEEQGTAAAASGESETTEASIEPARKRMPPVNPDRR